MADAEKTEKATPKRRSDAREKGDVAQSSDIPTFGFLLVAVLFLASPWGASLAGSLIGMVAGIWSGQVLQPRTLDDFHALLLHHGAVAGIALAPFALLLIVVGIGSNVFQTGLIFTTHPLKPKLEKLSPIKGMKRLFNLNKLFDLVKSLLKLTITVLLVWWMLKPAIPQLLEVMGADPAESVRLAGRIARDLILLILLAFFFFAAADIAWVRYRHEKKLRMTKNEVRDEHKQREGDPKLKGKIRRMQQEMSRQRMIAAVVDADVVVTNPTHYAVALQYRPPAVTAPRVLAKGRNHLALRIRAEAEKHGVPIVENPPIAQLLYKNVAVDQEIPESLYKAVAEVLAYIYRLDPKRSADWRHAS